MHELLGAYALDAVDVDERAAFEAHLATCSACAQELDELRAMLADLAESTAVAPPPALRARVLQGVTPSGTEGPTGPARSRLLSPTMSEPCGQLRDRRDDSYSLPRPPLWWRAAGARRGGGPARPPRVPPLTECWRPQTRSA